MLSDYNIVTILHEGPRAMVYRAVHAEGEKVIIKMLRARRPAPSEIARLEQELELTRALDIPDIVRVHDLVRFERGYALIKEDMGGVSLEAMRQAMDLERFYRVAIPLARAVAHLHEKNVIHRDINPRNVIFNPDTNVLKLTDFGIASRLSPNQDHALEPETVLGSLHYMSPEQTGRMNRALDARSDLYSLGVTFYEMLTGRLPFPSDDPAELVHSHLAREAPAPESINPDIPGPLAAVIMKLLAKTAEDRYQSARGLIADLEFCRVMRAEQADFTPGRRDVSDRFRIPQMLYGREKQLELLMGGFESAQRGVKNLIMLRGPSGSGKSVLVRELHRPTALSNGYFIAGKFEQYAGNIPFSGPAQAVRELIRQVLSEREHVILAYREKIMEALGDNARLMTDFTPELELIIGEQPAPTPLPPAEARNRFHHIFAVFLSIFARPGRPLVLFLDDVHWSDEASLRLLTAVLTSARGHHLLVICSYREGDREETLRGVAEDTARMRVPVLSLELPPLTATHISDLIADTLHRRDDETSELVRECLRKTNGNPFFLKQFLRTAHDSGLFEFDGTNARWTWEPSRIRNMDITENVIDLMVRGIRALEPESRRLLRLASGIGNRFDLRTLALIAEQSMEETARGLWPALDEGLLLPLDASYRWFRGRMTRESALESSRGLPNPRYRFLHDRVQQAAYSLMEAPERQKLHLLIGRMLLSRSSGDSIPSERLFEIANQLNTSVDLITDPGEKLELAQLNLEAGIRAKAAGSHYPAYVYLKIGLSLLGPDGWEKNYQDALKLHEHCAEAAGLCMDRAEAERLCEIVLQNARTLLDKVHVFETRVQTLLTANRVHEAVQTACSVLSMLGMDLPAEPGRPRILLEFLRARAALAGKSPRALTALPEMRDARARAMIRIMAVAVSAAYMAAPNLYPIMILRMLRLSLKYGNTRHSIFAYANYGLMLCGIMGNMDAGYAHGTAARDMVGERTGWGRARVALIHHGFIQHWKQSIRTTIAPLLQVYQDGIQEGDPEFAGYGAMLYCSHRLLAGDDLVVVESEMDKYTSILDGMEQAPQLRLLRVYSRFVRLLRDRPLDRDAPYDEDRIAQILRENREHSTLFTMYALELWLAYLTGAHEAARRYAEQCRAYRESAAGTSLSAAVIYFEALNLLALCDSVPSGERDEYIRRASRNLRLLKKWDKHAPANQRHRVALVRAELHRVRGKANRAREEYEIAQDLARSNGCLYDEALASELLGRFLTSRRRRKGANFNIQDALRLYGQWGARTKVRALREEFVETAPADPEEMEGESEGMGLDMSSLMKSARAISGPMVLGTLLEKLTELVLENAGARRGVLLLEKDGELKIEARGSVDGGRIHVLEGLPYENDLHAPSSVIRYVARTRESLVLADAREEVRFAGDDYFLNNSSRSVLCAPIRNQGQLLGIIYLENDLVRGAFTARRLQVLEMLAAQAAISLQNARLFTRMESSSRELERLGRIKDEFLSNLSHELKTPLTTVYGLAEMLSESETDDADEIREQGRQILANSEILLDYINDLMLITTIEVTPRLAPETIKLWDAVWTVVNKFSPRHEELRGKPPRITPDIPGDFTINADAGLFTKALGHLIKNALDYNKPGGRVIITASRENGIARVNVLDTGIGIEPRNLDRIFDKFYRVDTSLTYRVSGVGLGLFLARQIARLHGGDVYVESTPGEGSSFTLVVVEREPEGKE